MSEMTFNEGLEDLVRETIEASQGVPDYETLSKAVYEYYDVLGYQVMITIGKDILEEEYTYEEDGD